MKLVFSKNSSVVSKLIRFITNEDVSHCGFIVEPILTVIHANFLGTHAEFIKSFNKRSTIVYCLEVPMTSEDEIELYKSYLIKNCGRPYDFGGIVYFGVRIILNRLFSMPIPERNLWSDSSYDYCVEALCRLSPALTGIKGENEMLSPKGFYLKAREVLMTCPDCSSSI